MTTARAEQASALLPNGDALEAGGSSGASAEVYNPNTGAFSTVASMHAARTAPTAVTLHGGKVLVIGGGGPGASNAEVYDPTANTWTLTSNNMTVSREEFPTAALLPDGRVLVVGGGSAAASTSADIYNPATNSFTAVAPMGIARTGAVAITLPSGKVLVVGGEGASTNPLASAEVYDPTANSWTAVANGMSSARVLPGISALPGGNVLVAGGVSGTSTSATTNASADIYNPATNSFTPAASMSAGRYFFGMTALPGGRVLADGGIMVSSGGGVLLSSAEIYDPSGNSWTPAGSLNEARAAQGQTLLGNGEVLAAGGISGSGPAPVASAELYTPSTAPGAPQAVAATPGNREATVTWTPPASDGGSAIKHYTVKASTGQTVSTPDGRTDATISGLQAGHAVSFTVTATNAIGTGPASGASNSVTPGPPNVAISGVKSKLKLASFLHGLKLGLAPNEPVSLQVSLMASATRATIARAFNLTLAARTLEMSGSKRTVKLVPNRRLVGAATQFKVRLVVVAIDSAGNHVTEAKTLSIKP